MAANNLALKQMQPLTVNMIDLHPFGWGKPRQICENCGTVAKAVRHVPGSIILEIILWICFLLPGLVYTC